MVKHRSKIKRQSNIVLSKKDIDVNVPMKQQHKSFLNFYIAFKHSLKRYLKQKLRDILLSKMFHKIVTFFVAASIVCSFFYGVYRYVNASLSNSVVVSKSEIIYRVSKLTNVPQGDPTALVRVEDAESLKKQNSFYENVKSGDYVLIYPKVAIIYNLQNNSIVAIKKSEEK